MASAASCMQGRLYCQFLPYYWSSECLFSNLLNKSGRMSPRLSTQQVKWYHNLVVQGEKSRYQWSLNCLITCFSLLLTSNQSRHQCLSLTLHLITPNGWSILFDVVSQRLKQYLTPNRYLLKWFIERINLCSPLCLYCPGCSSKPHYLSNWRITFIAPELVSLLLVTPAPIAFSPFHPTHSYHKLNYEHSKNQTKNFLWSFIM